MCIDGETKKYYDFGVYLYSHSEFMLIGGFLYDLEYVDKNLCEIKKFSEFINNSKLNAGDEIRKIFGFEKLNSTEPVLRTKTAVKDS